MSMRWRAADRDALARLVGTYGTEAVIRKAKSVPPARTRKAGRPEEYYYNHATVWAYIEHQRGSRHKRTVKDVCEELAATLRRFTPRTTKTKTAGALSMMYYRARRARDADEQLSKAMDAALEKFRESEFGTSFPLLLARGDDGLLRGVIDTWAASGADNS